LIFIYIGINSTTLEAGNSTWIVLTLE